ncbi:hypothetical protein C0J52_20749 [Blattella germanica]|nr:hypothetical protein C0J52_20749 [Blattella germanica]
MINSTHYHLAPHCTATSLSLSLDAQRAGYVSTGGIRQCGEGPAAELQGREVAEGAGERRGTAQALY